MLGKDKSAGVCRVSGDSVYRVSGVGKGSGKPKPKAKNRARREVIQHELRQYRKQFQEAQQTKHKYWVGNDAYDLVDMKKFPPRNCVKGRGVLTVKRDKDGKFLKV